MLDQHCVRCHGGEKTEGKIDLTGAPQGAFSRSYVALMQDDRAFWHVRHEPEERRQVPGAAVRRPQPGPGDAAGRHCTGPAAAG